VKWLDRVLGRPEPDERDEDERALEDLRSSFKRVHQRTKRLEQELLRVNADLRRNVR
jgi:hypothetical protein